MDINADGMNDMVMATFEGATFWIEGTKDGFKKPQYVLDRNEQPIRISMYWDDEQEDYLYVDRTTNQEEYVREHHLTSTSMVDWDDDGDFDLLLGANAGALYLCLNQGNPQQPMYSATNLQVKANGQHLTIQGGLTNSVVCDWNEDGLFDILCGGHRGGVFFFANVGSLGQPEFAESRTLIRRLTLASQDETTEVVPSQNGLPVRPSSDFYFDAVDYDNDGDLDLLVGGKSIHVHAALDLNNGDRDKLAELEIEVAGLSKKLEKFFEEADGKLEELERLFESDEFSQMQSKLVDLTAQQEALAPSAEEAHLLWLYRNRRTRAPIESQDIREQN